MPVVKSPPPRPTRLVMETCLAEPLEAVSERLGVLTQRIEALEKAAEDGEE